MLALLIAAGIASADCSYDKAAMLALSPDAFDQDVKGGWRPLGDKPACYGAAADLLASYRMANWSKLTPEELHLSYWHEGQVRAAAGETRTAAPYLMAGVKPGGDAIDFADYAIGTVDFLEHDLEGLKAARQRLADTPEPSWWADAVKRFKSDHGREPSWPPNLDVLNGLLACFDSPYKEAYSPACRSKPTP